MVFDEGEIKERVLEHFTEAFKGQRTPAFSDHAAHEAHIEAEVSSSKIPQETSSFSPSQFEDRVCSPYSFVELCEIVDSLPDGKAAGMNIHS